MYKVDIFVDAKETAALERRRIMEQQRQSRIFNARERTIGVDVTGLDKQLQEKKIIQEEEKLRNEKFASEMKRCDKIGELLVQREAKDRRDQNKMLVEFRKENQRVQDRREYDINDPDFKLKDVPARVSDNDPRLTVSGMQRFDGEDLEYERRKKLQKKQLRDWTALQKEEKERLEKEAQHAQHLYQLKACELDQRAVELAEAEQLTKRALNMATKEYNHALAKEKDAEEQHRKMLEEQDNFTEMSNNIHGDLLSENPAVAQSAFGSHRVVPDRWKGMSPQQVQEVLETQEIQREEKQILEEEERRLHREWERQRVADARAGLILETQLMKKRRELNQKLSEENKLLAKEQNAEQYRLNTEVYVNAPAPSFFAQFNTSSR